MVGLRWTAVRRRQHLLILATHEFQAVVALTGPVNQWRILYSALLPRARPSLLSGLPTVPNRRSDRLVLAGPENAGESTYHCCARVAERPRCRGNEFELASSVGERKGPLPSPKRWGGHQPTPNPARYASITRLPLRESIAAETPKRTEAGPNWNATPPIATPPKAIPVGVGSEVLRADCRPTLPPACRNAYMLCNRRDSDALNAGSLEERPTKPPT